MEKGTTQNPDQRLDNGQGPEVDASLEALFEHASRRPLPPEEDRQTVMAAVHQEWQAVSRSRRLRRNMAGLAVAASTILAIGLLVFQKPEISTPLQPVPVAVVEKANGQVRVMNDDAGGAGVDAAVGTLLLHGQVISTGNQSGLALRLDIGIDLRIDQNSEFRLSNGRNIDLRAGRIYVDTQAGNSPYPVQGSGKSLVINTQRGAVTHTGTQFMVTMMASELTVSVREGRVEVSDSGRPGATPLQVSRGQLLAIAADGERELGTVEPHGENWQWAEDLGAGFVLDGRTMTDFFDWVASESGLEIRYASEEALSMSEKTVLHGKIELPATRALDVVLMSSDLSATIESGVITISLKP